MLLTIDFKHSAKDKFNQVLVDIQGVKVEDPEAFITVRYANSKTGEVSREETLPVTAFEEYAGEPEESTEPQEETPAVEEAEVVQEKTETSPLPFPLEDGQTSK